MDDFLHITAIWMHIFGLALWVGPQFFLAFGWVPASRAIADPPTRVAAMRTMTTRFAYLGGIGLGMILVAGMYLIMTWRDYYGIPDDASFTGLRFGVVFIIKMNLLIVMLVTVALHTFLVGPKLLEGLEAQARGEDVPVARMRALRLRSMALSLAGLVLTLAIMALGAMLNSKQWSLD